jgi:hypothetical protein
MEKGFKFLLVGLLVVLLTAVPVVADAHGGFGGGAILGFGLGLFTGLGFAPRPVYVGPVYPSYYVSPPPVAYRYYPAPNTAYPAAYGYTDNTEVVSAGPPPAGQSSCREWSLIRRQWENRWDSYHGRWRPVLVERWGWTNTPCGK